jgi:hypothetical protein
MFAEHWLPRHPHPQVQPQAQNVLGLKHQPNMHVAFIVVM